MFFYFYQSKSLKQDFDYIELVDILLHEYLDHFNGNFMNIDDIYPSLSDLKKRAKSRLPFFAWEYLDSATGVEDQKNRNREAVSYTHLTLPTIYSV